MRGVTTIGLACLMGLGSAVAALGAPMDDDEVVPVSATTTTGIFAVPRQPAASGSNDAPPPPLAPELEDELRAWDRLQVNLAAGAWFARVSGDVTVGNSLTYDLKSDLGLSSMETSFAGDLEVRWRFLNVRVGGSSFSTDGGSIAPFNNNFGGVNIVAGDPLASQFSMWNIGGEFGVDLYRPFADRPFPFGGVNEANRTKNRVADGGLGGPGGYRSDLRLGAFVGVRAINTDLEVTSLRTNQSTTLDQTWTAVYIGGRVSVDIWLRDVFPLLERMSIDADGAFGPAYPGTGSYYQVRAGLTVYPIDNLGVTFGYRLQNIQAKGRNQDLDASVAGLFVGGVLHF
ncbi:MAG: hypothetical protein KF724_08445 [Phycisphaeraceae bacterium]|nr:hypothetical protein [Phycisphaeraceae bacterium]